MSKYSKLGENNNHVLSPKMIKNSLENSIEQVLVIFRDTYEYFEHSLIDLPII